MENNMKFVEAWYNAANDAQDTFTYDGVLYAAKGGGKTFDQSYTPVGADNTNSGSGVDNTITDPITGNVIKIGGFG